MRPAEEEASPRRRAWLWARERTKGDLLAVAAAAATLDCILPFLFLNRFVGVFDRRNRDRKETTKREEEDTCVASCVDVCAVL